MSRINESLSRPFQSSGAFERRGGRVERTCNRMQHECNGARVRKLGAFTSTNGEAAPSSRRAASGRESRQLAKFASQGVDMSSIASSDSMGPTSSPTVSASGDNLQIQEDILHRSADMHWPEGLDPTAADMFVHNEILIQAPPEQIWQRLIDATAWPGWYSNARDVALNEAAQVLGECVTFEWTTYGFRIASAVAEFVPCSRLGWFGTGEDLRAYHTLLLVDLGESTHIVMEELQLGGGARRLAETNPGQMHRGHDLWNISLKFLCET